MLIILFAIFLTVNALALGAFEMRFHTWVHVLPVALVLFILTIAWGRYKGKSLRRPDDKTSVLMLTFMGLALFSCLSAAYPFASFLRFKSLLAAFVFFWAVFTAIAKKPSRTLIGMSLVVSGAVVATIGLLQYLGAINGPWPIGGLGLRAPFVNHNHLAGYLEMIIPIGFAMLFSPVKPALKLVIGYGTFIMVITHVLSLSRGGWLSLLFALSVFFVLTFMSGKRKLVTYLMAFFSLFLLLALYQIGEEPIDKRLDQLAGVTVEKEESGRLALFKSAINMGLDSPLRGVGFGQFRHNYIRYRTPKVTGLPRFAHNDYLHIFAELGLPGFAIILAFTWQILSKGLKRKDNWLSLGATCGAIAILVHSMVDFNLHLSSNALLFAFIAAICLSDKSYKIRSKFLVPVGVTALIILVVIVPSHLTLKETGRLVDKGRVYLGTREYSRAIPCFKEASALSPQIADIIRDSGFAKFHSGKLAATLGVKERAVELLRESIADYDRALKINPDDAFVIHRQGVCESEITRITRKRKSANAAIDYFRRAHELDPLHGVYSRWLGTHLLAIGEEDEGLRVLTELTRNPTTSTRVINNMLSFSYAYLTENRRLAEKISLVEKLSYADRITLDNRVGLFEKATLFERATDEQKAALLEGAAIAEKAMVLEKASRVEGVKAEIRTKLIALVPDNSEGAFRHLAGLYLKDGKWTEAREMYKKAVAVATDKRRALDSLGGAALANDDLELAEQTYVELLGIWKDYRVSNKLAAVAGKRKDLEGQEKWLARGIELAPDLPGPILSMALFLTRSGDPQKKKDGIEKLRAMSLIYRDFYQAPYHLGLIARSDKDYYRAIEHFGIALKRSPDNVGIKNVMAWTYVQTGLAIKGYRIWDKAILDHPKRWDLILSKASAHYGQREYARAVEALRQYKKFVPDGKFRGKPLNDEIARISILIKPVDRW